MARCSKTSSNRNQTGPADWDVGVANQNGATGVYRIAQITSEYVEYASESTVNLPGDEYLALREFYVDTDELGPFHARMEVDPADGPFRLRLLDAAFSTGDLLDSVASAITDETGVGTLQKTITTPGYYCLVLYRDPTSGAGKLAGPASVALRTGPTPPNFRPFAEAPGWASPLVPRPAADGTTGSVPQPSELPGDLASTYLNLAVVNDGPNAAPAMGAEIDLDGVFNWWVSWGNFPGGAASLFNWGEAQTVRGGRHTLSLRTDATDQVVELDELDNDYAEQWVWRPAVLAAGPAQARPAPPDPLGGLEDIAFTTTVIPGGEDDDVTITPEFHLNCDGIRTPAFSSPNGIDGYWGAVALMSGASSDADLQLFELSTGAKDGFADELGSSSWGAGHSDFVLVNFNLTGFRAFDAGILRGASGGLENVNVQVASSTFLAQEPSGQYGDFALPAGEVLALHELYLKAGDLAISLHNLDGAVDYGLSLHAADAPMLSKEEVLADDAISWLDPAGAGEGIAVSVPTDGYYCLAVWKATHGDLALEGSYRLYFQPGVTPVEDLPNVAATRFAGVHPNPFNPRTTIAFELATSGDVRLDVFDLRGKLVRSLARGRLEAGRHELVWDGADDRRRPLASGTYFLRLVTEGVRESRKLTLLK